MTATPIQALSMPRQSVMPGAFNGRVAAAISAGRRLGLLTARVNSWGGSELVALLLDPANGSAELWETPLAEGATSFPSMSRDVPQAHWFERAVYDFFGLLPEGHPRLKSLILHEAWPDGFHPLAAGASARVPEGPARRYEFLTVSGSDVYEIPVGPIHAGIIEPGHFRLTCLGEVIQNLEIRLGYQHRGVERRLTEIDWRRARHLAEAVSSDTAAANALAHAMAIEQILGVEVSKGSLLCRAAALEIERIASHIGDLAGLCGDIGFAAGTSIFGRLRGRALGLAERLTGSRFLAGFIVPGGITRLPNESDVSDMAVDIEALKREFVRSAPLIEDNAGVLERMENIGIVKPSLAADFGLVGPAGRASGVDYDVRRDFRQPPYVYLDWKVPCLRSGDILARSLIRIRETTESLTMVKALLDLLPAAGSRSNPSVDRERLPPNAVGLGIVEAWRGELIHLILTDDAGRVCRYALKDPSFNNWTGLAIAARGELVADFPLCNKSFGLSYSGNDL